MYLRATEKTIDWLDSHHIMTHHMHGKRRIKVGDLLAALDTSVIHPFTGFFAGNMFCTMGSFSYVGSQVGLDWQIGRYCSLSWNITCPHPRHPLEWASTSNFTYDNTNSVVRAAVTEFSPSYTQFKTVDQKPGPKLGHDVWIGAGAVLMPGITIGTGAAIAAHSVVVKDVKPYEIVGGNPAKHIRFRFDEGTIALLQKSEWWNYKFTDFNGLDVQNPAAFAAEFLERKPYLEPYLPAPLPVTDIPV